MTRERALLELTDRVATSRVICEVHRDIFDRVRDDPELRELVVEAYIMGKKMDAKLREYNAKWYVDQARFMSKEEMQTAWDRRSQP